MDILPKLLIIFLPVFLLFLSFYSINNPGWYKRKKKQPEKPKVYETVEVPKVKANLTFYGQQGEKEQYIVYILEISCDTVKEVLTYTLENSMWSRTCFLEDHNEIINIINTDYFQLGTVDYISHEMVKAKREVE